MSTNLYYIEPNENAGGYDIMKRDSVVLEDGKLGPERVCTIYSMDYFDAVLEALVGEDYKTVEGFEEEPYNPSSPVFEEDI
jgi:hypothetical protein